MNDGGNQSDDIVDSVIYAHLLSGLKTRDEVKSYLIFPIKDRDFPPPKETVEFKQEYQWTVIPDLDFTNDMLTEDIIRDARESVRRWDEICFMDCMKMLTVTATDIPLLMLPPGKKED
jgi:hypothetical protein